MDVGGVTGTAWRNGEVVGEFELMGGRGPAANGRETEDVRIRFTGFVARDVSEALEVIRGRRQRLSEPLIVDLELDDGRRLEGCQIAGFWGGGLGERWFGIGIDLDALAEGVSS
jgi:hypothetical protein